MNTQDITTCDILYVIPSGITTYFPTPDDNSQDLTDTITWWVAPTDTTYIVPTITGISTQDITDNLTVYTAPIGIITYFPIPNTNSQDLTNNTTWWISPTNTTYFPTGNTSSEDITDNLTIYVVSPVTDILEKMLFFWDGFFIGDDLKNELGTDVMTVVNKDFLTNYIPPTSTATFNAPNTEIYKTADEDNFWFTAGGDLIDITISDLYGCTAERTFVKYSNAEPYNVYWIGILKTGEILTDSDKDRLSKQFELWIYYFGELNDYGVLKDNGILP